MAETTVKGWKPYQPPPPTRWWIVRTTSGREFGVKGDSFFGGAARQEAEERLDPGERISSWYDGGPYNR